MEISKISFTSMLQAIYDAEIAKGCVVLLLKTILNVLCFESAKSLTSLESPFEDIAVIELGRRPYWHKRN